MHRLFCLLALVVGMQLGGQVVEAGWFDWLVFPDSSRCSGPAEAAPAAKPEVFIPWAPEALTPEEKTAVAKDALAIAQKTRDELAKELELREASARVEAEVSQLRKRLADATAAVTVATPPAPNPEAAAAPEAPAVQQ